MQLVPADRDRQEPLPGSAVLALVQAVIALVVAFGLSLADLPGRAEGWLVVPDLELR